jgi:ubiquitin carboxyl-terminal hydrolase 4/11
MKYFSTEEVLTGNDKWYCGKCKDHVVATKKMEIYSAPDYLIVHLKRFSHSRGMFGGRKINSQIHFPTEGLDLTN